MTALVDLRGQRFGRLTVTERAVGHSGSAVWIAVCDCGNVREVRGGHLVRGKQVSCGCYRAENNRLKSITHGKSNSAEFNIWMKIKARCLNPSDRAFKDYGARGIDVCQEWVESFDRFYADMGARPSKKHSIDRIDNNQGYRPGNCRWASVHQQARNRRSNVMVTYFGMDYCVSDLASLAPIGAKTFLWRVRSGWSVVDAFETPIKGKSYA